LNCIEVLGNEPLGPAPRAGLPETAFALDHRIAARPDGMHNESLVPRTLRYRADGDRSGRVPTLRHAVASPATGTSRWNHRT